MSSPATAASLPAPPATAPPPAAATVLPVIFAVSGAHLLNDTIQSLLPALYPVLKDELQISFTQVGLITLAFQLTASILQPFVGLSTDRRPQPFSLAAGTACLPARWSRAQRLAVMMAGGDGRARAGTAPRSTCGTSSGVSTT